MQLLKQTSSVVVRSQVFNLRRALKLEGVGCRHYKNQFGYFVSRARSSAPPLLKSCLHPCNDLKTQKGPPD